VHAVLHLRCSSVVLFAGLGVPTTLLITITMQALLRGSLRKAFGGIDLWLLGLGIVVGGGWAQLTGVVAQQYAG
jgi:hypothetical protein